jgi:hypothetical protein
MESDASAKQFQPNDGYSNIYVFRNETVFGSGTAVHVSLDGKIMGKIGAQNYVMWEVAPGDYIVGAHSPFDSAYVRIDAKARQNHFARLEWKFSFIKLPRGHDWQLHEVGGDIGRYGVLQCKRVAP